MSDVVQRLRMIVASNHGGAFEEHLMEAAEYIERLREEREWVPVTERLPEDDVQVLVWGKGWGTPAIGWREHQPWYTVPETIWTLGDEIDRGFPPKNITHWQPLPPGPEASR